MQRKITGFHLDEEKHWVAQLECGHNQHVRHDPPWSTRTWVTSQQGRNGAKGKVLDCLKCDRGEPEDEQPRTGY